VKPAVAVAAILVLVLAGCGGGKSESTNDEAAIDLTVRLWPNGESGDSSTWTLRCEPAGGDHPDPDAACAALTAVDDPFGPLPPPKRCGEIPGGDEDVALIEGNYRGRKVRSRFSRETACVSPRWDRIAQVFPTGF
jgi:hypothetical protein